jgi:outer membrane biosynthesis protein TonB
MTQDTGMRLGARVQRALAAEHHLLLAALAAKSLTTTGQSAAERRALLALRIAMHRMVPQEAQVVAPPPPPEAPPEPMPEPMPEPVPVAAVETDLPPAPAKPRKPARLNMSSVRIEDAALLLGAAFADDPETSPAQDQG